MTELRKLWEWRHVLWYLVRVDLKVTYRNKLLGYVWSLLDPLMLMLVYVILVQYIFRRGEPLFPVLLFSALLAWHWFIHAVQRATTCITGRARLVQTVAFPKILLPTQQTLVTFFQYIFGLGALFPLLLFFKVDLTAYVLWLPLVIAIQFMLTWGLALMCAVLGVYFRDWQNILQFGLRMWWYLSPGLYSVQDRIPVDLQKIYMLNPFASLFNAYKNILVRGELPSSYICVALGTGLFSLLIGLWVFSRKEADLARDV